MSNGTGQSGGAAAARLAADAEALAAAARAEIESAADLDALAKVRARYAGKNGALKELLKGLSGLPKEERPAAGAGVNRIAAAVQDALDARRTALEAAGADEPDDPSFDPTLPGAPLPRGSRHPVSIVLDEMRAIFVRMGFDEVTGPEVEDAWHNFDALNIPAGHPARERTDQFYVEGGRLLRSQTSTVQVRVMETRKPPLRVFAPGRVYRPETVDARHLYAFHQVEGLVIDEGISLADLKACIRTFAESMYGSGIATRFRPHNFPFTEVSAELDVSCPACGGTPTGRCATCGGEGWIELGGCGMVHPRVLSMCGIDPERWTGFAFGMGVERIAMRRWALEDIRALEENDVRFLSQFA
ncbi:MAG: Phenylalanine--tRNA ligase alpha subunit [Planctomycetes bacterium]|nr:Phenylalanine--tRNA ligase alpha subunit [Planctomycetota bacterium]